MLKLRKNDLIEIEWIDAYDNPAWLSEAEARKEPPEVHSKSVGYYLRRTKDLIFISASIGKTKKCDRDRRVIPRGTIKKITRLYRRK